MEKSQHEVNEVNEMHEANVVENEENEENEITEENEEEEELSPNDDVPLKISQLKTDKRNDNLEKKNKGNFDEEKDYGNENKTKSMAGDMFTNFSNRLDEKLNEEIKKSYMNKKGKYSMENMNNNIEKNNINKDDKIINNRKKKITVKNESLIRLIHQINNNKDKDNKKNE